MLWGLWAFSESGFFKKSFVFLTFETYLFGKCRGVTGRYPSFSNPTRMTTFLFMQGTESAEGRCENV